MVLRMGLIGTGAWGRTHAMAYHAHSRAKLVAVCDIDEARCKAFAEEFGIQKTYSNPEELAADPEVEAISVVTPDFAHRLPALAVINEGKPLLIEKPLATTVEDALVIREEAKKKGILAMVDFHNRFNPQFDTAKRHLGEGNLGAVRYIYMRHSNSISVPKRLLRWSNKSSSLWFLGSHSCDLIRWLFGSEVVEVYGVATYGVLREQGIPAPDVWSYTLKFANGGVGNGENAWILPDALPALGDFRSEVIAEKGVYYTTLMAPEVSELYADTGRHDRFDYLTQLDIRGQRYGFTLQSIQYFVDCVLGETEPFITLDDGVANTKILCAVEMSAQSGMPVRL